MSSTIRADEKPSVAEPFQPTWESLKQYSVPDWYRDAKFGIFVHWGPQTLAGAAGSPDGTKSPWKELAQKFQGDKFDASQLAELFKKSGARYVVQVAEHHDGYAMYDSSLTPWSSVKLAPKRDFVAELSAAVRRQGLIYGASSHTEENWWFYSEPPKKLPALPKPGVQTSGEYPPADVLENWYARLVEIAEKYDPQVMWFDWSIEQPCFEPYLRKFAAYYYNRARQLGREVVINYKYDAFPAEAGVLDVSVNTSRFSWQPESVHATPWQFDTWSSDGLWFWRPNLSTRPTSALIAELADVVSKNGNYLLNVTPDPSGTITAEQRMMLTEIGDWLMVNGEAIYGTRRWAVYGEGPTSGLGPSFSSKTPKRPYTSEDIRFTHKGDAVYAIVLGWPADSQVTIRALADGSPHLKGGIRQVSLLGSGHPTKWSRNAAGLVVDLSSERRLANPCVIKIDEK